MNLIFLMFIEVVTILGRVQSETTLGRVQRLNETLRGSVTLHATQCSLHFDKPQKNEIHSLNKSSVQGHTMYWTSGFSHLVRDPL